MSKTKFVVTIGSSAGVGTTTIANYTAVELARRGHLTLLIEFRTTTGFSVYMQGGLYEIHKSLSEVMVIPEKLSENTIRSAHSDNLFYVCMNFRDDSLKMRNYQAFNLSSVISEAKRYFEYIILDLPADGREPAVATVLSKDFVHKPDALLMVVNEKASTYKYLNDFNSILELAGETNNPKETTFILNSIEASHYQDYIIDYLPSLPITKPVNVVYLPYIDGLTVACNKGSIYETGINKKTKKFFSQIDLIADIIEKDLKSKFADIKTSELEESKKKGFLETFLEKFKSKKNSDDSANIKKEGRRKTSKANKQDLEELEDVDFEVGQNDYRYDDYDDDSEFDNVDDPKDDYNDEEDEDYVDTDLGDSELDFDEY